MPSTGAGETWWMNDVLKFDQQFFSALSLVASGLALFGMFYGVHEWTGAHTNGVVDARFIAVVSTAVETPLQQVAMIPMLAWITNSAPANLKATFFAMMASFTNLALSLGQLGTKSGERGQALHFTLYLLDRPTHSCITDTKPFTNFGQGIVPA
jgi:hypothetical protein